MKTFQWGFLRGSLLALALAASAAGAADLPALPEGLSVPKSALKMPPFNLPIATGGSIRADELKGKVVIARFWATW